MKCKKIEKFIEVTEPLVMDFLEDFEEKCEYDEENCIVAGEMIGALKNAYMLKKMYEEKASLASDMMVKQTEQMTEMHEDTPISDEKCMMWAKMLVNSDGTAAPHWTMEETSSVAQSKGIVFEHITEAAWWVWLNYIYAVKSKRAKMTGRDTLDYYVDTARDLLFCEMHVAPMHYLYDYFVHLIKH